MTRLSLLLLIALAACSPSPSPPSASGRAEPGPVAVAKGVVETQGGLLRVFAPRDGLVLQTLVEEGDHVAADQVLARMDDRRSGLALAAADADLAQRRAQVEVAAAREAGAAREARRLAALASTDAATAQDSDSAATVAAIARGEQHQAQGALLAAQAERRLAAYEVDVRAVRAPAAGRVVRRAVSSGGYAAAAAPIFTLEPDGARIVRAELDESLADRVRAGMSAVVSKEFQQGRTYSARVLRVSDVLAGPSLVDESGARADARVVSVLLALPADADLRLGQRVLVRFAP